MSNQRFTPEFKDEAVCQVLAMLMFTVFAQTERVEQAMLKVTIAVDGMMKSKIGAT